MYSFAPGFQVRFLFCRVLLPALLLWANNVPAQVFGNEWIDFNQTYYKLSVAEDGVYRLTFNNLQDAGFPVSAVDPRRIQIFHRGVEQAIRVEGQEDANFGAGDFIEFYGQVNDGTLDTELYLDPGDQPHTFYNLFSDSSAYFLTWKLSPTNGKRMAFFSENNVNGIPAETDHRNELLEVYTDQYSRGRRYPEGGNNSNIWLGQFDMGEGWIGANIQRGEFRDFSFDLVDANQAGVKPQLNLLLVGNNNREHDVSILVGPDAASLRTLTTAQFSFHRKFLLLEDLEWSDIGAGGGLIVRVAVSSEGGADVVAPGFVKVTYPQNFDMTAENTKVLNLANNLSGKSYVEITGAPAQASLYDISDLNDIRRIGFNNQSGVLDFVVDNSIAGRKMLVNGNIFLSPTMQKINFRAINPANHNYAIISHPDLRQSTGSTGDPVKSYASYRASPAGGGFDTLLVDIDQLYNQFSYGEQTPLAIRRFTDFMIQPGNLEYLFIIGKGLSLETRISSTNVYYRQSPQSFSLSNLVPTNGVPGSDVALIAGLGGNANLAPVPIGRLNAREPEDVVTYLNKVIEMEAVPFDGLWRKDIMHLSGGQTASELVLFASFVDGFKNIAEDKYLGGNVTTINKTDNSVVQLFNVSEQVNRGVSLITFYGHSAASVTDIEIGNVSNELLGYDNKARYPAILVNGCDAGDIFNTFFTFGEDWIFTPDKGALNFMAHSTVGFVTQLRNHTNTFYGTAYGDSAFVGESIGTIILETNKRFLENFGTSQANITQSQQVILQGDPAVKLFGASQPDYAIKPENVFFQSVEGGAVTAADETLRIGIIVENYGRTGTDSITVNVNRTLSNGVNLNYDTLTFAPVFYQDTLFYDVPMGGNAFGNNSFEVQVDSRNLLPELDENNNTAFTTFFIPLSGTANLLPYNYAVVNSQPVQLIAQSTDPFSDNRSFLFEIDTVNTFDSPFKKTNSAEARVIARWEVGLLGDAQANDSTVYYWRTKFANPLPDEEDIWSTSSFIYIRDSPEGWSQARFDQFDEADVSGLERNDVTETWQFRETQTSLEVVTYGELHPDNAPVNIILTVQGIPFIISSPGNRICRDNSINALAFDHQSGLPYVVLSFTNRDVSDLRRCGRLPQVINNFTNGDIVSSLMLEQYVDGVAADDYVLLLSLGTISYNTWSAATVARLEEIGVTSATITAMQAGEPIIILGRKGAAPGTATVITADGASVTPANEQQISLNETLFTKFEQGSIGSTLIGPAESWNNFVNKVEISEQPQTDVFDFDIYGVDLEGNETLLFDNVQVSETDLAGVNASTYPYLRIKYDISDEINLTAAQLKSWQVFFEPTPEGVLYLTEAALDNFEGDKQEGELVESSFVFENISSKTFKDSLTVRYSLFNQNDRTTTVSNFKINEPAPGQSTPFELSFDTSDKAGKNNLNVFVNPRLAVEQNYNNNIIDIPNALIVNKDTLNPIIDVVFDGVYILDGEIVSPSPLISITLKDDNETLLKQDTVGVDIFLGVPCQDCTPDDGCQDCEFLKVNFSDPAVRYFEASENTDFKVEYQPEQLEDGLYTLLVQASDASGNQSGVEPYKIRFEVINESSITNFYPYPNPFSTSTRFVFTLTGSEIPDQLKIQIMTVSGKIVREITQNELGMIRVGNNISDFAWDGRDEYGDQLANGVYLYRVIMGGNAADIKRRETAADKAFKKGFGKLYLLK